MIRDNTAGGRAKATLNRAFVYWRKILKKVIKSITHKSLCGLRSIIKRPGLKESIKNTTSSHINTGDTQQKDLYRQWIDNSIPNTIATVMSKRQSGAPHYLRANVRFRKVELFREWR